MDMPEFATCADRAEWLAQRNAEALEMLLPHLYPGETTITHEICGGGVEEHIFLGIGGDGRLRGFPTSDTIRLSELIAEETTIAPSSVTHVDREPLRALAQLAEERRGAGYTPSGLISGERAEALLGDPIDAEADMMREARAFALAAVGRFGDLAGAAKLTDISDDHPAARAALAALRYSAVPF